METITEIFEMHRLRDYLNALSSNSKKCYCSFPLPISSFYSGQNFNHVCPDIEFALRPNFCSAAACWSTLLTLIQKI